MKEFAMKKPQHLSNDLLVRFLDDESSPMEASSIQQHLSGCAECRQRYHDLGGVSKSIDNFVRSISPQFSDGERVSLALLLSATSRPSAYPRDRVFHRFGWGMALAASLAVGLIIAPQFKRSELKTSGSAQEIQAASLLEVDGETFVPLPYSNPDLPIAAHHIVQMQVPVSSLADAGVHFESISNEVSGSGESVLADVLLGIDGQPLGVHVLSVE